MTDNRTNYEKLRDDILTEPELKAKYILSKERIKLEMMLETLRLQVMEDKSRKSILSQITKISNRVAQITL
jgi:hypothetical protein